MTTRSLLCPTLAALLLSVAACRSAAPRRPANAGATTASTVAVLPTPRHVALAGGTLRLPTTLACHAADTSLRALLPVLDGEYRMLVPGGRVVDAPTAAGAPCRLALDPTLGEEAYRLTVDSAVRIVGGSYRAVAMGSVTLLQMAAHDAGGDGAATVPRGTIADAPSEPFRALLVDLGRQWHDVASIEQLVELARWYKVGYLQLHLTDDQILTFPTRAFPELPTPGQHYTVEQLRALDEFARVRGVALLPELEVPGHASLMVARRRDVFGYAGDTSWRATINMGRESAYAAVDSIVGEIADVFRTSPYIHVGGDEVDLSYLKTDAEVQRYMRAHDLSDVDELYRQFLVRVNEMVKRRGKRTIVWEGFRKEGRVQIPRDVLVIAWETKYQLPQDLLAGGYTLVNASWKPLYIANQRKWPVEYVYDVWNPWRWENWVERMPSYTPIQLDSTPNVIGAMMCAWEQPQWAELESLRGRVAALGERTWNASLRPARPYASFTRALAHTDAALQSVLAPVAIEARGLRFPGLAEGHFGEERWFGDTLTVALRTRPDLIVRYTLDGTPPTAASPPYSAPIALAATTDLRARAFTAAGEPAGYDRWLHYELHPIRADVQGDLRPPLDALWEKENDAASFARPVTVRLSSLRRGDVVRYTLDGTDPTAASPEYRAPIVVTDKATVRARLFTPSGHAVGEEWSQRFERATSR